MSKKRQYWHVLQLIGGPLDGEQWDVPEQGALEAMELGLADPDNDRIMHWYAIHAEIGTATFLRSEGRIE